MPTSRNKPVAALILFAVIVGGFAAFLLLRSGRDEAPAPQQTAHAERAATPIPEDSATAASETVIVTRGQEVPELRYLPEQVNLTTGGGNPMATDSPLPQGIRRLRGIRLLSDPSLNGPFISPVMSPDGLQMAVVRPGFQGVFLLGVNGGEPVQIAEGSAREIKWTEDGKIEVLGEDGMIRTYGPDGTLEGVRPHSPADALVYADNDVIFAKGGDGTTPMPLTTDNDRYYNPRLSPDGTSVIYQGLYSGLYLANADGSGQPRYIGPGNNPAWLPDGSGFVFDRTTDDGHDLISGDLVYVSRDLTEMSNITGGSTEIEQMPFVGPDGETVIYEVDGGIYIGTL